MFIHFFLSDLNKRELKINALLYIYITLKAVGVIDFFFGKERSYFITRLISYSYTQQFLFFYNYNTVIQLYSFKIIAEAVKFKSQSGWEESAYTGA